MYLWEYDINYKWREVEKKIRDFLLTSDSN